MRVIKYIAVTEFNGDSLYLIDLFENQIPLKRTEINKELLDKEVLIDGYVGKVIAINMFAKPEESDHSRVDIRVKFK
jgi:hypothetical protein